MADDAVKRKNPMKIWLILIFVLLVVITVLLLTPNKVVIEDQNGATLTGSSGKFLRNPDSE